MDVHGGKLPRCKIKAMRKKYSSLHACRISLQGWCYDTRSIPVFSLMLCNVLDCLCWAGTPRACPQGGWAAPKLLEGQQGLQGWAVPTQALPARGCVGTNWGSHRVNQGRGHFTENITAQSDPKWGTAAPAVGEWTQTSLPFSHPSDHNVLAITSQWH